MRYKFLVKVFQISIATMLGLFLLQSAALKDFYYTAPIVKNYLTVITLFTFSVTVVAFITFIGIGMYKFKHGIRVYLRKHHMNT